jgi:hypothetical protein
MDWEHLCDDICDILNVVSLITGALGVGFLCYVGMDYAGLYEGTIKSYKHLFEPGVIMLGVGIGLQFLSFMLNEE